MAHVFVSHANQDCEWVRQCLVAPLRAAGHEPFFSDDNIAGGADFIKRITDELGKSDKFLVVVSPRSVISDWVKTEVELWFRQRRDENPIPVLMEPGEAYRVHPRLVYCQAIDLSDATVRSQKIVKLLATLQMEIGGEAGRLAPSFDQAGFRPGQIRDDNRLKLKLVWCPPGNLTLGSPSDEKDRHDDEDQSDVMLTRGFWLAQYPVTQIQWKNVLETSPWNRECPDCPATSVNWDDAIQFCQSLTSEERTAGRLPVSWEYTLPTEAQWEYACRAGTTSRFSFGDDESNLKEYAWFSDNAYDAGKKRAHPVAQKRANGWSLYDMHGNVWEWCRDIYAKKLLGGSDPEIVAGSPYRVRRGGSWSSPARRCRSANRGRLEANFRLNNLGVRIAAVMCSQ